MNKSPFAFVFPGQGSQSVGMLNAWGDHPEVKATLHEASDALGEDIALLIAEGPKEALALTTNTQPVMLVAAIAAYRVGMSDVGQSPNYVAGHSLGEYSALVASNALTLSQAVPLVRLRAQAMQEAVPVGTGAMAAILGMDAQKVVAICQEITQSMGQPGQELVEAVNFNDPMQTVIAGSKLAVEKASEALKAAGAKRALALPVSAPFHCSLMKPAADKLKEKLHDTNIATPTIALINNIDVKIESQPEAIRDALYRQAFGPVRWVETIQKMASLNISNIVECGPGKVLAGMVKRINPDLSGHALFDPTSLQEVKTNIAG